MGRFVNPSANAFPDVVHSKIYVDKTGLLNYTNSVLDTSDKLICNSRPRRFGKSVTADMLAAYYSRSLSSETLFSGLEISKNPDFKKYLNQYNVIELDIQQCVMFAKGAEHVISYIEENTIHELREAYPDILPEALNSLPDALSRINAKTGERFIVIIDEWDVLIRDDAMNYKVVDEYIDFLRGMFKGSEASKYLHLAYITGILPIKKTQTQSALNNFHEYTMIHPDVLAPYIGFTDEEVYDLCRKYDRDFRQVKRWYDGYLLGDYQVYNPVAIVRLMTGVEGFKSYWSKTGSYDAVIPLINMNFDGLKTAIIDMLSGDCAPVDTEMFQNDISDIKSRDDVITYLIHLGYLGYDARRKTAFVPNEEIRQELSRAVRNSKWDELINFTRESVALLDATLDMNEEKVAEEIEKIHQEYASAIQYHDENSLSSVLSLAYLSTMSYYFKPIRELPSGKGFADFVYIPKPDYKNEYPALVIELKWDQDAETAIQQIYEKKYPTSVEEYTGKILLIGISYDKKSKKHWCKIEKYEKTRTIGKIKIDAKQRTQILMLHDNGVSDEIIAQTFAIPVHVVREVVEET